MTTRSAERPYSNFVVILWLVLFFPVGLIMVWTRSTWTPKPKWAVTISFAVICLGQVIHDSTPAAIRAQAQADAKATATQAAQDQKDVAQKAADLAKAPHYTVNDIFAAYSNNNLAAKTKFQGSLMVITGPVDSVDSTIGSLVVDLVSSNGEAVHCNFPTSAKGRLIKLNKGDAISIRGTFDRDLVGISSLSGCDLITN